MEQSWQTIKTKYEEEMEIIVSKIETTLMIRVAYRDIHLQIHFTR